MKRGGRLARYTPLQAKPKPPGERKKRKPLAKVGKRGRAILALLAKAKKAVRARSGGWCEEPGCTRRAEDYHHVKFRSQGGEHTPENLRHICRVHHDEKHP